MTPRQPATDLWTLCTHTACGVRLGRRALRTPNTWLVFNHPTLADVASLVQWVAVAHGARLPWDAAFVHAILNLYNGRFTPRSRSPGWSAAEASAHGARLEGVHAPAARWAAATLGPLYAAVLGERAPWTAQDTAAALAGLGG